MTPEELHERKVKAKRINAVAVAVSVLAILGMCACAYYGSSLQ